MLPFDKIGELVRYLGARLSVALAFGLGVGVLIYLHATDAGVTLSDSVLELLIIGAVVVVAVALIGRTVTDWKGKRSSGEQPPPEDRRGE